MNARARELFWPGIAAAFTILLLLGLGFWQLRRLDFKEALIAKIETRAKGAPIELPPRDRWSTLSSENYDYQHVTLAGNFDLAREALIYTPAPQDFGVEPGYFVLTPFRLDAGGVVLVNRGFIPQSAVANDARKESPQGRLTLSGVMRAPQSRNIFTPEDDPAHGRWFTSDASKIAQFLKLSDVAPFTVVLDSQSESTRVRGGPRPVAREPEIVNNHLSYAFTWFSLAGGLAIIFFLYARSVLTPAAEQAHRG
jgi:surfeit locus 1 family protein